MKTGNTIVLMLLLFFSVLVLSCTKNYTQTFIRKFGDENFTKFRGTQFVVRGAQGNEISVYGTRDSVTNGIIWFYINSKTQELMPDSFKITPDETKLTEDEINELIKLKEIVPTFIEYRVRSLSVNKAGDVFIGVNSPESNLFKPVNGESVPATFRDRIKRKYGDWYLLKTK